MRYVLQQQPMVSKQFPGKSATHLSLVGEKKINNNNTKNVVLRVQISGYHQEDCPAVENNESRTETGFLHHYFLPVSIIICHKCMYLFILVGKKYVQCENIVQTLHIKASLDACL